jgi:hypothetical protein
MLQCTVISTVQYNVLRVRVTILVKTSRSNLFKDRLGRHPPRHQERPGAEENTGRTPGRQEEDPETDENTMETFNRPL